MPEGRRQGSWAAFGYSDASREKLLGIKGHPEVGRLVDGLAHEPSGTKHMEKIGV